MSKDESIIMEPIPSYTRMPEILQLVNSGMIDFRYLEVLKSIGKLKDEIISNWLNINVKTFRAYKKGVSRLGPGIQEHTVMLLTLMKHGHEVFGDSSAFAEWLDQDNFHLDGKPPSSYLNTISGIKFIDDLLSGIEHGDNA